MKLNWKMPKLGRLFLILLVFFIIFIAGQLLMGNCGGPNTSCLQSSGFWILIIIPGALFFAMLLYVFIVIIIKFIQKLFH